MCDWRTILVGHHIILQISVVRFSVLIVSQTRGTVIKIFQRRAANAEIKFREKLMKEN